VLTVADDPVPGVTVVVLGVVRPTVAGDGISTRALASGETDSRGRFDLSVTVEDGELLTHGNAPAAVLVAQFEEGFTDSAFGARPGRWFGTTGLGADALTGETEVRLDHELLYGGWDTPFDGTDVTAWRQLDRSEPSRQRLGLEVRGRPLRNGAEYEREWGRGQLSVMLPDDRPEAVRVAYPGSNRFQPDYATTAALEDGRLWGEPTAVGAAGGGWSRFSIAAAYAEAADGPLAAPLVALFGADSFSALTDERRRQFESGTVWSELDDELQGLFISVFGQVAGDLGTAVSAASVAKDAVEYAYDQLDVPKSESDPGYVGNGGGSRDWDPNRFDTVPGSWPAVPDQQAVTHRLDVTADTERAANRQPVRLQGAWETEADGARLDLGFSVDFARTGPDLTAAEGESETATPSETPTPTATPTASIAGRWAQRAADAGNTGYSPTTGPDGELEQAWSFNAGGYYDPLFGAHYAPVTDGERLYVPTEYGPLLAVRPDGSPEWRFSEPRAPNGVEPAGIAVDDERVYMTMQETTTPAVSDRPAVYAVSKADGSPDWRYWFPDIEFSGRSSRLAPPTLAGDTLFVFGLAEDADPAGRSPLLALDPASGEVRWRVEVPGVWGFTDFAPAVADGAVLVHTRNRLSAYRPADGEQLWSFEVQGVSRVVTAGETALVLGTPPDVEGSGVLAYDLAASGSPAESEARRWAAFTDDPTVELDQLTVDPEEGVVYVTQKGSLEPDRLHALDLADGRLRDSYTRESVGAGGDPLVHPVLTEDVVYFGDPYGTLVGIDQATGETRFEVEHGGIDSYPVAVGSHLYTAGERLRAWKPG
jgi:outer membrane protein assembly factor BamB